MLSSGAAFGIGGERSRGCDGGGESSGEFGQADGSGYVEEADGSCQEIEIESQYGRLSSIFGQSRGSLY